jgi:hypothetical protein
MSTGIRWNRSGLEKQTKKGGFSLKVKKLFFRVFVLIPTTLLDSMVHAQSVVDSGAAGVQAGGTSAIWIFANISYAGMRAQNSPRWGWRIISFIFGFPATLLTWLIVGEGSERAYGIELPRKRR